MHWGVFLRKFVLKVPTASGEKPRIVEFESATGEEAFSILDDEDAGQRIALYEGRELLAVIRR